jgi:hypothetical protein
MARAKPRNSCTSLFKRLDMLTLPCEYIFSLINLIVNNEEYFRTNSAFHSVNINRYDLHVPAVNVSCFQKISCYSGIRIVQQFTK